MSQWRGYADDAKGFSIGFSAEYLLSLSDRLKVNERKVIFLQKVEYDVSAQEEIVKPTYLEFKRINESYPSIAEKEFYIEGMSDEKKESILGSLRELLSNLTLTA